MRTTATICLSLPTATVDRLRQEATAQGMTLSGYVRIVLVSGMESPLIKMLQQAREEGLNDGPEV